ncbi:MAG: hypothetical protein VYA55_22645 [Pseudomonadota bacterium]|nr:hypothetical protein [Pseudomonadota bacterium]
MKYAEQLVQANIEKAEIEKERSEILSHIESFNDTKPSAGYLPALSVEEQIAAINAGTSSVDNVTALRQRYAELTEDLRKAREVVEVLQDAADKERMAARDELMSTKEYQSKWTKAAEDYFTTALKHEAAKQYWTLQREAFAESTGCACLHHLPKHGGAFIETVRWLKELAMNEYSVDVTKFSESETGISKQQWKMLDQ